jgi:hypothetical protein
MEISSHTAKPIHELEVFIRGNIGLQLAGIDVAIPNLIGAPGGGKTSSIKAWGLKFGWQVVSIHYSLIPIEELSGLPQFIDVSYQNSKGEEYTVKGTEWSFPEILSKIMRSTDPNKPVILFLDDFHLCGPAQLELGFEMFTERTIRGYKLPDNVAFILAGNNSSKAGSKAGNSAITNRCMAMPVVTDFDYWRLNYAIPNKVNYKIITFLSNSTYSKYFHMEEQANKPWGSPRSWTRLSAMFNPYEQAMGGNISSYDLIYLVSGHVGSEAAADFNAYYKLYLETEMHLVFDGKKAIDVPNDMSGQYIYCLAACGEFFNRIGTDPDKTKLDKSLREFCPIVIALAKKSLAIATKAGKEVVDAGISGLYLKFKTAISAIDREIAQKITDEIFDISKNG